MVAIYIYVCVFVWLSGESVLTFLLFRFIFMMAFMSQNEGGFVENSFYSVYFEHFLILFAVWFVTQNEHKIVVNENNRHWG